MNWNAKKSRDLFFSETGEPKVGFWAQPRLEREAGGFERELPAAMRDWDPVAPAARSNCPLLHRSVSHLGDLVDPRWRARAVNIYAGRTFVADDVAVATQKRGAGMIAVSHEFTTALFVYALAFGRFLHGVEATKTRSAVERDLMQAGIRASLDMVIRRYRRRGPQGLRGHAIMTVPSEAHEHAADAWAEAAEDFTVAHELAHHLVRHMSSKRDRDVAAVLAALTERAVPERDLGALARDQRDELEADFLAAAIIGGAVGPPGTEVWQRAFVAVAGSALSLVTIGHLRDEWTAGDDDSHPGCLLRLRVLLDRLCALWGRASPEQPDSAHLTVHRLAAFLMTFALVVSGESLAGVDGLPDGGEDPDLNTVVLHYMVLFGRHDER